ncbi:MAG: DNA polymerase III subunit delta [Treponema sp.]|nr:DNA polymerase III subunit delta [Treponema sp.]
MAAPVYLFTGPETGGQNESVQKIKASLKKQFGEIEEYSFFAMETTTAEFLTVLQNESLFAAATCVVVKNAEVIKKKDEVELLLNWIETASSPANVLILLSDEISIDSKIEKAVPPSNKKIFWELFETDKIAWINSFFKKNNRSITADAVSLILEMVENNTAVLKNECSRFLVLFPEGHQISADDVDSVLYHSREENAFSLFAQMADSSADPESRLAKSIEILQKIRLSKENSSFMIIAGLASCFRKLSLWIKLKSEGMTDDFNLKKNGFTSSKQKTQYSSASKIWTAGQVTAILAVLASGDMAIRSGGSALEDVLLQKMIYEIIIKKGAACASYDFSLD